MDKVHRKGYFYHVKFDQLDYWGNCRDLYEDPDSGSSQKHTRFGCESAASLYCRPGVYSGGLSWASFYGAKTRSVVVARGVPSKPNSLASSMIQNENVRFAIRNLRYSEGRGGTGPDLAEY